MSDVLVESKNKAQGKTQNESLPAEESKKEKDFSTGSLQGHNPAWAD